MEDINTRKEIINLAKYITPKEFWKDLLIYNYNSIIINKGIKNISHSKTF